MEWRGLVEELRGTHRVHFERGLSDAEVALVEERFRFRFPPDLRAFLQTAMPLGSPFPDWRYGDAAKLKDWLDTPKQGVLFDVQHNGFWLPEWGERPSELHDALAVASTLVDAAPRMIPVFAHRMMPDEPHAPGNPVFSVHQTDIIVYGINLEVYLRIEFGLPAGESVLDERPIRFWDPERFAVRWNNGGNKANVE